MDPIPSHLPNTIPICSFDAALASTPHLLFRELYGRSNLGEGALKTEGIDISRFCLILPSALPERAIERVELCFDSLRKRATLSLEYEVTQPDRRALDDVVFDVLGLTQGERDAVYEAVIELVQARLQKANSV